MPKGKGILKVKTLPKETGRLRRVKTASEELDISVPTIRKLIELRKITRYKFNSMTFVDVDEIVGLMRVAVKAEATAEAAAR